MWAVMSLSNSRDLQAGRQAYDGGVEQTGRQTDKPEYTYSQPTTNADKHQTTTTTTTTTTTNEKTHIQKNTTPQNMCNQGQ